MEWCADGIIFASLDGTIQLVNAAAASMFGISRDDAIGKPLSALLPPSEWAQHRRDVDRVRGGEAVIGVDVTGLRADGTEFPMSITISPLTGVDHGPVGMSMTVRDQSIPIATLHESTAPASRRTSSPALTTPSFE